MDIPEQNISEILDKNPSQETLHILLPLLMEKVEPERVIKECLKALSNYPEDYTIHKILSEAYFADGNYSEAEAEADLVINNIERLAGSYKLKADVLINQKQEREAVRYLVQFIGFFPEDEKAVSLLGSIQESIEKDIGEPPDMVEVEEDELIKDEPIEGKVIEDEVVEDEPENRAEALNTKSTEGSEKRKKERLVEVLNAWRSSFKEDTDSELNAH